MPVDADSSCLPYTGDACLKIARLHVLGQQPRTLATHFICCPVTLSQEAVNLSAVCTKIVHSEMGFLCLHSCQLVPFPLEIDDFMGSVFFFASSVLQRMSKS